MNRKQAVEIFELLKKQYPDAKCSLDFNTPFEMMVAVMLSAQCTDERVNKVTAEFFPKYLRIKIRNQEIFSRRSEFATTVCLRRIFLRAEFFLRYIR